jgi:catalase-peroxidase
VNVTSGVSHVVETLEGIQQKFNNMQMCGKKVSLADLIVLGGCAAVEKAAKRGGYDVEVPFTPGRTDASQEQTDPDAFAPLEPIADGFRNYLQNGLGVRAEELLVDKAFMLKLSAPEMTALVGGMRVLKTNAGGSQNGVFTDRPGTLTNDFFVHLLDMSNTWRAVSDAEDEFEVRDRVTEEVRWTASRVDLVFGSNSELRSLSEVFASDDGQDKLVSTFVAAWGKVMNLDRFDL